MQMYLQVLPLLCHSVMALQAVWFFMFIVIVLFISLLDFSEAQWVLATSLLTSVPAVKREFSMPISSLSPGFLHQETGFVSVKV